MVARKKNIVKNIIHQAHLYLGMISGIVVFIVSITGAIYVFEKEGREIFSGKYYYVKDTGGTKVSLQQMTDTVVAMYPGEIIRSISFKEKKNAAFIFTTNKSRAVSVNPYTASVIGERNMKKDFFEVVERLHKNLLLGNVGKEIVRWNVLIFFILCVSGLVLWWPKQRRFLKQATRINFKTKNRKRLNWDLHSVLGFYALLVLLVVSLTGMFFVFDWVKKSVAFVTNNPVGKKVNLKSTIATSGSFLEDAAYQYAITNYPGAEEISFSIPADSVAPMRLRLRYPYTIVRKQNTIYFDRYSGKVLSSELFKDYTAYDKIARSNYDFHVGSIRALGIGSKIIYCLAALVAASLPVTGFYIWWGRRKKKKKNIAASRRNAKRTYPARSDGAVTLQPN